MTPIDETAAPTKAGTRAWIGLAVIALPCLLYSMDLTVLNLAVPQLTADLKPTSAQLLWIVDIYGFLAAGSLVTMGTLGDRIGRRRLLLIGAGVFGLASVVAAFSTSAPMLIASRALLGVAAATLAPSTLSLIRNMFPDPKERTFAIGVWVTSFSVGGIIGPLLGGVILAHFWWGAVFLLAVPVMVLLLILGPLLLPEYRDPSAGRLDLVSAAQSLAAILAVIYGIKRMAEDGVAWLPALAILAGLVIAAVFVHRQQHLAEPLIDLNLFRAPAFGASLVTNVLSLFVAFGSFLLIAQYLQFVLGMTPLQAGLWTAPSGVAFIVGSMSTPLLLRVVRPAGLVAGGLCLAAAGFALLSLTGPEHGRVVTLIAFVVYSLGFAPVFTLLTDLIIGAAAPEKAGAASGLSETSAELGGALGIALLGSLVTTLYRAAMNGTLPSGLPPAAAEAARSTIGGALAIAREMPGSLGSDLVAAARAAYAGSLQTVAAICVVILLLTAVLIAVALRGRQPGQAA